MKVNLGTKRPAMPERLARHASDDNEGDGSKNYGWMKTKPSEQRAALEESNARNARNRAPELWLQDGDEKLVRFRHEGALGTIFRYRLKVDGKWRSYTMPREGDVDLFATKLNLNATFAAIYELVDIKGFTDKQQKKHKFVPRFYVVGSRQFEQLELIRKKRGPLNKYDVTITRSGEDKNTTYAYFPEMEEPADPRVKSAQSLAGEVETYYAPPTEAEQRAIVARVQSRSGTDDGDD